MRMESPGHTLQTTALVNEAYLRLVDQSQEHWQNRAHFFGVAARVMRRVLVDHARARNAIKRGGLQEKLALQRQLGQQPVGFGLQDLLEVGDDHEIEFV